jgi:hypothetical protein
MAPLGGAEKGCSVRFSSNGHRPVALVLHLTFEDGADVVTGFVRLPIR